MTAVQRNLIIGTSRTSFSTSDKSLDGKDIACVDIAFFFVEQEVLDFSIFFADNLVATFFEQLVESVDKVHEAYYFFIAYGNVSRGFVSNVYFMTLLNEAADSSTH